MNEETVEGRLLAHRRILQLIVGEIAETPAGIRLRSLLHDRSTLQDGQEDPGAVETLGIGVELAAAEEFRSVVDGLTNLATGEANYVRAASSEAMQVPPDKLEAVEEAADKSFPASGPPERG